MVETFAHSPFLNLSINIFKINLIRQELTLSFGFFFILTKVLDIVGNSSLKVL